ncbi:hypothetical protein TTHERM_00320060 (macronuclear) [Tetrahymena thermophila SB210]|uniref:Cyclic nucleotide-binding domain protein n=1 Tax=Tetrahymena thermophila (strain SB210) TaxID=312017 RepID=Q237S9_TETTS|nr:hypothetical protein TTHERM_00320060 [Tetrahymena thermophila SB210]EAR92662.1 hypothetical protein TTHERM_00320060 [Tetrahymena thermophila SB210]|eukprot:XP_001012907.1 hypothetical protein TTHERM_00320060 [Tetrahymena thermophila SB210]
MENIIKILKQKKLLNIKLKDSDQKIYNQQVKQCLKQFPLIQNYLKDVVKAELFLDDIVEQFDYQQFKEGDIIYKQNDFITDSNYIYFIIQGRVSYFEAKPPQIVKSQIKMYQELQKLRKQIAQLGKNQDYQSTKKYLDQIINLENILQVKQQEELFEICSRYQSLQEYFYSDWKSRQCKFVKKDDVVQEYTIGESDIFANKRSNTCLVLSSVLHTLKIDLKLFNEKFFQKIFQIQFLSNVLKEQLHLFEQNQFQIQKIAEQFVLQYFSNNIYVCNEDSKGIYVLLFGIVSQMNGTQEIQSIKEGEIFGLDDLFAEKRRSTCLVRNEEKAKIYFLRKDLVLENKWLVDSITKVNSQKVLGNQLTLSNQDISCKKKEQYFDRRFRITEEKLNGNLNFTTQNQNLGSNKIHQRQKHLHHQLESAEEIINNSKKILEKQQQPYIKTFQEQKYLQYILNQQKKINNRIPSLYPGSNEDSSKQFSVFKKSNTKQIGSCSSLDQTSKNIHHKQGLSNQNEISQIQQKNSTNLIESLKIYFNNKRATQQEQEREISNSIPQLNLRNNLVQPQVYPLSDDKRQIIKWNSRLSFKKLESQQISPQNSQAIQACTFNFQEELKNSKKISSKKIFHPIHSLAISQVESNHTNKKQLFNLDQYLSFMKEQNEISKQQVLFLSDLGRTPTKKKSFIMQDNLVVSLRQNEDQDGYLQFEEDESQSQITKNQSAFYATIKNNDSTVFIKQQTKKSLSLDKNKDRRSSSQNKNKVTIASFINSHSKSLKKLDIFDKNQTTTNNEEESEENQQTSLFQPSSLFQNQQQENNQTDQELQIRQQQQSNLSNLNHERKQNLSLNKFNRTSYIQNIFPDRRDSVSSQNASCYDLTTRNSENSSPINSTFVKNRNSQIVFKSKFQISQQEQKLAFSKSTVNLNKDNQTSLQNSDTFFDKCNTESVSSTRTQPKSSTLIQQQQGGGVNNSQIFKKKNSLSDINEKLVIQLQHKITEYSDKSFLQSLNQLKEQKKQINAAIQSEFPNLNKLSLSNINKNKLNIMGQLSNQQNQLQNKEFQERLKLNNNLFENKILSNLLQKSNNQI